MKRFDLTETIVIAGVSTAIGVICTQSYLGALSPLAPMYRFARTMMILDGLPALAERYGPDHDSQFAEEWIVRDAFQDKREGIFVDVWASQYQTRSVTYTLETRLAWSGLAIEAQQEYGADYLEHRPKTRFIAAFVSDTDDSTQRLYIPTHSPVEASGHAPTSVKETRDVPTATLNRILQDAGITRIDLLNLDVEGFEMKALAGFDIDRYKPALLCIEAHRENRQAMLDYFHAHGYVVVGAYLRIDPLNLYFRPASGAN